MKKAEDVDALLESFVTHYGPKCKLADLTGTARAVFDRGMERTDIPQTAIARALQSLGVEVSRSTIERHRHGDCVTCRTT